MGRGRPGNLQSFCCDVLREMKSLGKFALLIVLTGRQNHEKFLKWERAKLAAVSKKARRANPEEIGTRLEVCPAGARSDHGRDHGAFLRPQTNSRKDENNLKSGQGVAGAIRLSIDPVYQQVVYFGSGAPQMHAQD